jgi:hypothetical protein
VTEIIKGAEGLKVLDGNPPNREDPDLRDENQKRHLGFSSPICEHRKARKNSILKQWFLSQTLSPAGTLFRRRHILSPPLATSFKALSGLLIRAWNSRILGTISLRKREPLNTP